LTKNIVRSEEISSGRLTLLKSIYLFVQYEKIVAMKAIGIEIGNNGWKNKAVKSRFA
jgi:hypothetical protein